MLGFGLRLAKNFKKPNSAPIPELEWILAAGFWNDSGVWIDSETWID